MRPRRHEVMTEANSLHEVNCVSKVAHRLSEAPTDSGTVREANHVTVRALQRVEDAFLAGAVVSSLDAASEIVGETLE